MEPCFVSYKLEDGNKQGRCCCNCHWQRPINAHPWNKDPLTNGSTSEIIGYGCTCPEFFPHITFFEKEHGMCEVHTARDWADPEVEQVWDILTRKE